MQWWEAWRKNINQEKATQIMLLMANTISGLTPVHSPHWGRCFINCRYDHVILRLKILQWLPTALFPQLFSFHGPQGPKSSGPYLPILFGVQPCLLQFLELPAPLLVASETCPFFSLSTSCHPPGGPLPASSMKGPSPNSNRLGHVSSSMCSLMTSGYFPSQHSLQCYN